MKYGLLTFKNTDNLGDDIQSYAQMRFLPRVDCYVDREHLDTFSYEDDPTERVSVIMNAWFLHTKFNWPPSESINPLFVSSHFSQYDRFGIGYSFLDGLGGDYLRHYAPIGARDETTKAALEEHGIPSYVTGCMTLTLQRQPDVKKTSDIVLCDIKDSVATKISEAAGGRVIHRVTHSLRPKEHSQLSFDERLDMVRRQLSLYQSAAMVITMRLHCALPCLALGTPVLLVTNDDGLDRLGSFLKLVHHCDESEVARVFQDEWAETPPPNSDEYLRLRDGLEEKCQSFIRIAEEGNGCPDGPDIPMEERFAWQKKLVEHGECARFDAIVEQDGWLRTLTETKSYLDGRTKELQDYCEQLLSQIKERDEEIESLNRENRKLTDEVRSAERQNKSLEKANHLLGRQLKHQDEETVQLEHYLNDIQQSVSFKTGRAITYLPRKARDIIGGCQQMP